MDESSVHRFSEAVRRLVDLLFTDDMEYFDSLEPKVERELGTPLAALSDALREGRSLDELRSAALLVEDVALELKSLLPMELYQLIIDMQQARLSLV